MTQNVKKFMIIHLVLLKLLPTLDFKVSKIVNKMLARHISVIRDSFCQELTRTLVILAFSKGIFS